MSSAQHFRQAFANSTLEANVRNSVCFEKRLLVSVETPKRSLFFGLFNGKWPLNGVWKWPFNGVWKWPEIAVFGSDPKVVFGSDTGTLSTMNNNHNISQYIKSIHCNSHHVYTDYFGPSEGYHCTLAARCPRKNLLVLFSFRQLHWVVFVGVTHLSLLPMVCALLTSSYLPGSFERKRSSARPEANLGTGFVSNQYWTWFDWVVNNLPNLMLTYLLKLNYLMYPYTFIRTDILPSLTAGLPEFQASWIWPGFGEGEIL